jgi:hypothetical protein
LFEADLSPDCPFFASIKEDWASLDICSEAVIIILDMDTPGKQEAIAFLKNLLTRKNKRKERLVRDDYREIALILLGDTLPSRKFIRQDFAVLGFIA